MTGRPRLSVAPLRAAIQKRVDETNLREIAKEIGMSHSALARFLEGTTARPQAATLERMYRWREHDERRQAGQHEDRELAVVVLGAWGATLPAAVREKELENLFARIRKEAAKS